MIFEVNINIDKHIKKREYLWSLSVHYIKTSLHIYRNKGTLPIDRNLRFDRNTN